MIQKEEVEEDTKPDIVLGNLEDNNYTESDSKSTINVNDIKDVKPFLKSTCYNPQQRNPAHAGGEFCIHTELLLLQYHFHPTVALYAKNIIYGDRILYSGDPLKDFTLIRFLERFVFKNPKKASDVEQASIGSHLGQRKTYVPKGLRGIPVTSMNYMNTNEQKIPEDERFMYNYLQKRREREEQRIKNEEDEDSDMESVASDEFDEYLDKMAGTNADDDDDDNEIDYMNEVGDSLKQIKKKKKADQDDDEFDDEGSSGNDSQDEEDDEEFDDDEDEQRDASDDDNFDDEIDADFSDDDDEDIVLGNNESKKNKKGVKGKKGDLSSLFATAEEFSVMLEKTGASKRKAGSSNVTSNTDKSNEKQLTWEEKRNTWITDKISRKKLKSNKFSGKRKNAHGKGGNKMKKQKRN